MQPGEPINFWLFFLPKSLWLKLPILIMVKSTNIKLVNVTYI